MMPQAQDAPTAIRLDLHRFRYADARDCTLRDLHLELAPGTLQVITGDSGSGKSTLGAVLAGMLPRPGLDELTATFRVAGQDVEFAPGAAPRIDPAAWARQVGLLPQQAGLYLSGIRPTVAEELAFSLENAGIPAERMRARVRRVARELDLDYLLERDPALLSGGQQRLVALAALAVNEPAALVLDEPLAGLDARARTVITAALQRLQAAGTALLVLSSSDRDLTQVADRVFTLAGGTLHRHRPSAPDPLGASTRPAAPPEDAAVLLEFRAARLGYPGTNHAVLDGLDLAVRAGECLGLAGPNGAGKSTILKAAAGLLPPLAGTITAGARPGLLLQNPADQLFERTVRREVGFGMRRAGREGIDTVLERLDLQSVAGEHPHELPAAQRKLVALATALVREPRVLLLDEPTEDLDSPGRALLLRAMETVLARGGAVVLSCHDERFLHRVTHRIHRLDAGARMPANRRTAGR